MTDKTLRKARDDYRFTRLYRLRHGPFGRYFNNVRPSFNGTRISYVDRITTHDRWPRLIEAVNFRMRPKKRTQK
jgi:hypothetical protein